MVSLVPRESLVSLDRRETVVPLDLRDHLVLLDLWWVLDLKIKFWNQIYVS